MTLDHVDRAVRGRRSGAGSRAFALPLVVMVTLVVVVIVAAMLSRQETQSVVVAREVEAVRDWHFSRGVREIIDQWLKNKSTGSVRDLLAADGRAFDLVLDDGTRVSLYLADAQGTLLSTVAGLSTDERLDVVGSLDSLRQNAPPARYTALTRQIGPSEVSLWTAEPEVLNAVSRQAAGPDNGTELARSLEELRRSKERVTMSDIGEIATRLSLPDGKKRALSRMVTPEPSLFRFVLDVKAPNSSQPIARYRGFLLARTALGRSGGTGRPGAPPPRSAFLSWEKVPPR